MYLSPHFHESHQALLATVAQLLSQNLGSESISLWKGTQTFKLSLKY